MESHFRPPSLAIAAVGLALATFMQVLDTTIANVSLPTISGNLGVSVNQSTWVITSFAVSQAIGLPLTGFLAKRFGEVRVFVWCTLLFVIASFCCGISQSLSMLIFFRVIQGAVCGPMYPVTQSLMISIFPSAKRGMALAIIAMVTVVAPILGPILGGYITDSYSWRWIFFINIPIGIFCSFAIRNQMRDKVEQLQKPRMDYVGLIMLIIGVGLLQVVLDTGNDSDWFNSPFIVWSSIIAAVALAVFVIWEFTDDSPIVDLKLFRHRNFAAGTLVFVLVYATFFGIALLLPLWMQKDLGYTAIWAGLATAPIGILPLFLNFFIGKYSNKVDLRILASISFVAMAVVCFLYSHFNLQADFWDVALMQFMLGLGVAFFFLPVLTILLSDLDVTEIASGSGVATFLRTLGGSFAASILTFMWSERSSVHHAQLTESISVYDPGSMASLQQMGGGGTQSLLLLNHEITLQASQIAFNELFYAMGWILVVLAAFIWFAKPPFISGGK